MQAIDFNQVHKIEQDMEKIIRRLTCLQDSISVIGRSAKSLDRENISFEMLRRISQGMEEEIVISRQMIDVLKQVEIIYRSSEDKNISYLEEMRSTVDSLPFVMSVIPDWVFELLF